MKISQKEYQDYVREVQFQEQQREIAHRLQEDFNVFISYSHTDEETVRIITDLFDSLDIKNYVIDKKEIEWGDDIRNFAVEKITKCTHYLLVLSESSAKSKWCGMEFGIALGAQKEILLFLTNDNFEVPAYAANMAATSNIDVLTGYFSRDLIRPEKVEKFIAEVIDDRKATLSDFKKVDTHENDRMRWDAPDRAAIESEKPDPISAYIDDYRVEYPWRLVSIEIGKPLGETAVVLHYSNPSWRPCEYKISYCPELKGVLVAPKKQHSEIMGVRIMDDKGTERLVNRSPSMEEQLKSRGVYGWSASQSFWEKTFEALKNKLPV